MGAIIARVRKSKVSKVGSRERKEPEETSPRDRLLTLLAAQAEELGFTDRETRAWGLIFQREATHGVLSLEYRLNHNGSRWDASVQGRMIFLILQNGEKIVLSFRSTPHRLDQIQARRWRLSPQAHEPELRSQELHLHNDGEALPAERI